MTATPLAASPPVRASNHLRLFAALTIVFVAMAIAFAIGRITVDTAHVTVVPASAPPARSFECPRAGVC